MLTADEVQTVLGKFGKIFGVDHWDAVKYAREHRLVLFSCGGLRVHMPLVMGEEELEPGLSILEGRLKSPRS